MNGLRNHLRNDQFWCCLRVGRLAVVLEVWYWLFCQRCACCGHTEKENRHSQSKFRSQTCGYTVNAGVNGVHDIVSSRTRCSELWGKCAVILPVEVGVHSLHDVEDIYV